MLSHEKAQTLGDVSPGAPMWKAFRGFWLPVMRGARLKAGGFPVKFMVLSQSYVAFRGAGGAVAVFDERCPHRGCSLEMANARDDSLVCMFHGWKFHVSGRCIETPNEADPAFPDRVPLKCYPVREGGGMLWVYLGDGPPPRFPNLVFNELPEDRVYARMAVCDFNWLTGLEAILDPSHVALLHRDWVGSAPNPDALASPDIETMSRNLVPRIEFEETDYGFRYAAIRALPEGQQYVRVSECVAPSGVFIANTRPTRQLFIMSVPIDNLRSIQWYVWHSSDAPIPLEDRSYAIGATDLDDDNFYQSLKGRPFFGQDREAIRRGESFTGFHDIMIEDFVAGEAQGAWPDRTKEFLGGADMAIMRARRYLLSHVRPDEEPTLKHGDSVPYHAIQALAATVADNLDWRLLSDGAMAQRAETYAPA